MVLVASSSFSVKCVCWKFLHRLMLVPVYLKYFSRSALRRSLVSRKFRLSVVLIVLFGVGAPLPGQIQSMNLTQR
jgi:hypothetical protein